MSVYALCYPGLYIVHFAHPPPLIFIDSPREHKNICLWSNNIGYNAFYFTPSLMQFSPLPILIFRSLANNKNRSFCIILSPMYVTHEEIKKFWFLIYILNCLFSIFSRLRIINFNWQHLSSVQSISTRTVHTYIFS